MLSKIQENKIFLFICLIFLVLGFIAIYNYIIDVKKQKDTYDNIYNECQNGLLEEEICNNYSEPLKNRDSINTFGYITLVYESISVLQIVAPLLIIIASMWNFHKYLRHGFFINSLSRIGYKDSMKKLYKNALISAFILPVFLFIIFIVSCIISGNFDYEYGISHYGFDAFGMENSKHWIIFMIVYLFNFILHGIFWINIGIYNSKYNKNVVIGIIISYIEYFLIFVIFEVVFCNTIFYGTKYMAYFSLSNIWAYSYVTLIGMTLLSLSLAILSTFIVYLTYRNKEKVLVELEK